MIGIVVALESEAKHFLAQVEEKTEFELIDKKAYRGKICGKDIVLAISGIGKVNASFTTQALILKFNPTHIVNFGTAGGTNGNARLFEYYIIAKCCQFDFDLSAIDPVPAGYIQDYNTVLFDNFTAGFDGFKKINLASADRFSFDQKDIDAINGNSCSLRDMEGGAIAQVCTANKVPLVMIKGVTDVYGHETGEFYKNLCKVCEGFPEIVKRAIELL